MATVTSTNCSVCESQYIIKTAVKWCFECDEAFCPDCLKYHSNVKSTKGHAVIGVSDLKELPEFVLKIKHHCEDHGALFQNYCLCHEKPCCRICINSTHKNCTDLPPLEDVTKDARNSIALEDIKERLLNLKKYYECLRLEKQSNIKEIQAESKTIIARIKSIRLKLNHDLDQIEREVLKRVSEFEIDVLQSVETLSKDLKGKQDRIDEFFVGIIKMKNHASELQVFLGIKEIESEMISQENEIDNMTKDQLNLKTICFKENELVSAYHSEFVSYFGEIIIENTPLMTSYIKGSEHQAQNTIQKRKFEHTELKLLNNLNFKGNYVFGSAILENDTVCFADQHNNTLSVMTTNGSLLHTMKLPMQPFDIAIIKKQTMAVTTGNKSNKILIVNVEERSVKKAIQTEESIFGISFFDRKLIYSSSKVGLLSISLENEKKSYLKIGNKVADSYVAAHEGKLYCTDKNCPSVQCYNVDNTLAWEFKGKPLCGPRGIAVDKSGIVYVGNQDGGNVVVISADGSKQKVIEIDGIPRPRTLSFNNAFTRLLICGDNGPAGIFIVT